MYKKLAVNIIHNDKRLNVSIRLGTKQECLPTLATPLLPLQHCTRGSGQYNEARKIKSIQILKEEVKLYLQMT